MARVFIQETIDTLKKAANKIETDFASFQKGDINKDKFEEEYRHVLEDWLSEMGHEAHSPNNGCKYSETNPKSEYFVKEKI